MPATYRIPYVVVQANGDLLEKVMRPSATKLDGVSDDETNAFLRSKMTHKGGVSSWKMWGPWAIDDTTHIFCWCYGSGKEKHGRHYALHNQATKPHPCFVYDDMMFIAFKSTVIDFGKVYKLAPEFMKQWLKDSVETDDSPCETTTKSKKKPRAAKQKSKAPACKEKEDASMSIAPTTDDDHDDLIVLNDENVEDDGDAGSDDEEDDDDGVAEADESGTRSSKVSIVTSATADEDDDEDNDCEAIVEMHDDEDDSEYDDSIVDEDDDEKTLSSYIADTEIQEPVVLFEEELECEPYEYDKALNISWSMPKPRSVW